MKKTLVAVLATAATIGAFVAGSSAFAAQNAANTSQKGSLLIWPLITVDQSDPSDPQDTIVELSNDANASIHVECEYVNEQKGRTNFDFTLTGKQTVTWDALTLAGDQVNPNRFPSGPGNPPWTGNPNRGELICFATSMGRQTQVAWNELTGTATVLHLADTDAIQPRQGFKYNAWSFAARCAPTTAGCPGTGLAPDNATAAQGTPGRLSLTGANADGVYDACPLYNIANFMPNGAALGNIDTLDNDLSVVGCNQDLRERYVIHATKLEFTVWNSRESSFTGAFACVDSVATVPLSASDATASTPPVTAVANFDYSTLATPNARFQVQGISASPPCPFPTQKVGLLGVLASSTSIGTDTGEDQEIGNTTQGAGIEAGFVLWDPMGGTPPAAPGQE